MEEMDVPEGYRFRPDKYEAINYLRRRVNHQPQPCDLVKEMDVYNIRNPSELFVGMKPNETELFCFTTLKPSQTCGSRSQRKTDGGTWKEQGSKPIGVTPRKGAPAVPIGLQTSFSFIFKNGGKKEGRRYIMHQYSLPAAEKCRVVFCKIRFEDKKGGRSSCYRSNEEVNSEQQQQGRNYEEEQQAVSGSSSFVEGGGPSSSTSLPPAGYQDTTISKNYRSSSGLQQQHQGYMNYYPPAAAATSSSERVMTTDNNYEVEGSGVFSADVRDKTAPNYFVNNIHNTVEFPGQYYYSKEQQQRHQQYINMTMMNPSPSSLPESINYHNYKNNDEVQGGWSSYLNSNPPSPVPSAVVQDTLTVEGYSSSQQQQQQQYMMMNPSSSASDSTNNYSNNNTEELGGGGSLFLVGDPSASTPVFSYNNNLDLDDDQHAKELLPMQHLHIESRPPLHEIIEGSNQHRYQHHAPQPQSDDQQLHFQGEDTLSRWIRAQCEEWMS